jgi:hypothetical protein
LNATLKIHIPLPVVWDILHNELTITLRLRNILKILNSLKIDVTKIIEESYLERFASDIFCTLIAMVTIVLDL